jgi:hypothetical protein
LASATANRLTPKKLTALPSPTWEPGREWQTVNAIHSKALNMSEKSFLIVVAKNQFRRGGSLYGKIRTVAAEMGCDRKTVFSVMRRLKRILKVERRNRAPSKVAIDWNAFAALPSIGPEDSKRPRNRLVPKTVPAHVPKTGQGTHAKNGTQGVKSLEGGEKRGSAPGRPSQDTKSAAVESEKNPEREYTGEFKKLLKRSRPPAVGRPADELVAEFWGGILGKRIENVFYDSQGLRFDQQLRACVESAVTDVVNNRSGKAMYLRAEQISKLALEQLNGAETLREIADFGNRAKHCAIAVRNAVARASATLHEKQLSPAQTRSQGR